MNARHWDALRVHFDVRPKEYGNSPPCLHWTVCPPLIGAEGHTPLIDCRFENRDSRPQMSSARRVDEGASVPPLVPRLLTTCERLVGEARLAQEGHKVRVDSRLSRAPSNIQSRSGTQTAVAPKRPPSYGSSQGNPTQRNVNSNLRVPSSLVLPHLSTNSRLLINTEWPSDPSGSVGEEIQNPSYSKMKCFLCSTRCSWLMQGAPQRGTLELACQMCLLCPRVSAGHFAHAKYFWTSTHMQARDGGDPNKRRQQAARLDTICELTTAHVLRNIHGWTDPRPADVDHWQHFGSFTQLRQASNTARGAFLSVPYADSIPEREGSKRWQPTLAMQRDTSLAEVQIALDLFTSSLRKGFVPSRVHLISVKI